MVGYAIIVLLHMYVHVHVVLVNIRASVTKVEEAKVFDVCIHKYQAEMFFCVCVFFFTRRDKQDRFSHNRSQMNGLCSKY